MVAPGTPRAVLRARNLTKVYRMGEVEVHALRGVDLDLYAGELVVLLGPSGSGKSTLLNILGGLDVPPAAKPALRGPRPHRPATTASSREYRREHVGFVFQFYNLIPSLTARENVALVTEIAARPMPPEEALRARRPRRAAATTSRRSSPAANSSASPSPAPSPSARTCCSATSPPARSTAAPASLVLEAIERINRELGTTTVVITHNAAIAGMARPRARAWATAASSRSERNARAPAGARSWPGDAACTPLDRKLLRDLWRLRGQVLAIALVIACGIALLVMRSRRCESLRRDRGRLLRALPLRRRVRARWSARPSPGRAASPPLPGVQRSRPASSRRDARRGGLRRARDRPPGLGARDGEPPLNDLSLRSGGLPAARQPDEAAVASPSPRPTA